MPKARKTQNKKRDILSSDSEDEHQENNHNKKKQKAKKNKYPDSGSDWEPEEQTVREDEVLDDDNMAECRNTFFDNLEIFKMVHQNKNEDGRVLSKEERTESHEKLKRLFNKCNYDLSFANFMIRSSLVRWTTFKEDMKYWETWDKKEEFLRKSRSRSRQQDKDKALRRNNKDRRSRSRSRGSSRNSNYYREESEDDSGDRYSDKEERKRKEQVKCYGYVGFYFVYICVLKVLSSGEGLVSFVYILYLYIIR